MNALDFTRKSSQLLTALIPLIEEYGLEVETYIKSMRHRLQSSSYFEYGVFGATLWFINLNGDLTQLAYIDYSIKYSMWFVGIPGQSGEYYDALSDAILKVRELYTFRSVF